MRCGYVLGLSVAAAAAVGCSADPTAPGPGGPVAPLPLFSSPIAGTPMANVFYGAYRDHGFRDYECGAKYYAGHQGTDILLRNFTVQDSGVAVLAAAPGRVSARVDGLFDRNTVSGSGGFGNQVSLTHDGGVVSIYAHLRSGSVRVALGADVNRGDTLGMVGSSGNSNWPHLHFEVRRNGVVVDPFIGECNPAAGQASWINQLAYQSEFRVIDAGMTTRAVVTQADLLEGLEDVHVVTPADGSFLLWLNLFNVQAGEIRAELRNGSGAVLADRRSGGSVQTFSVRFFVARFGVELLDASGTYSIVVSMTPLGQFSETEIARREFVFDAAAAATASPRAPAAGPPMPDVWLSPDGGDMAPAAFISGRAAPFAN